MNFVETGVNDHDCLREALKLLAESKTFALIVPSTDPRFKTVAVIKIDKCQENHEEKGIEFCKQVVDNMSEIIANLEDELAPKDGKAASKQQVITDHFLYHCVWLASCYLKNEEAGKVAINKDRLINNLEEYLKNANVKQDS